MVLRLSSRCLMNMKEPVLRVLPGNFVQICSDVCSCKSSAMLIGLTRTAMDSAEYCEHKH